MNTVLTFELNLLSDYHLSAGSGLGSEIDSALLRDGDGMPVLRGSTIAGLLRDSLWHLLQLKPLQTYRRCRQSGVDTGQSYCHVSDISQEICPICYLFGTPQYPKRWYIGSARPAGVEKPANIRSRQTASHAIQRVRVNPRTRRAAENQLFSQENGDRRLTFRFSISCFDNNENLLTEAALLVAAARHIQQIGRSRRRGLGLCRLELVEAILNDQETTQQNLLQQFEQDWLVGYTHLNLDLSPAYSINKIQTASQAHQQRMQLIVRLDEPVLVAQRAETANQFDSLETIPGVTVRGAFAALVAGRNNLSDDWIYTTFVQLFRRGQVHFSSLYPTRLTGINQLYPAIPAPVDLFTCKVFSGFITGPEPKRGHGVWPFTQQVIDECPHAECKHSLKRLTGLVGFDKQRQEISPNMSIELHPRIAPRSQRVQPGYLYGYMAIDGGQYFVGELTFADEKAQKAFLQLTNLTTRTDSFELQLGKATRRGYGQVTACLQVSNSTEHPWIRLPLDQRVKPGAKNIILTLLTDLIEADPWGRFHIRFSEEWLAEQLQLSIEKIKIFAAAKTIDGFNTHLGLPRQRDIAIFAGSSVRLDLTEPLLPEQLEQLQQIEQKGLGLRQNEGFGQIVFNHPIYAGYENIGNAEIKINRKMELRHRTALGLLGEVDDFVQKWGKKLKELDKSKDGWKVCQAPEFLGVARWLHTNADKPLPELRRRLVDPQQIKKKSLEEINKECRLDLSPERHQHLKQLSTSEIAVELEHLSLPDQALKEAIPEYGDRYKASKIEQKGLNVIFHMLNKLEDEAGDNQTYQRIGLQMLADRIAAEVKLDRKESSQ